MGKFTDEVRQGGIKQPTQVGFDRGLWIKRFNQLGSDDPIDTNLRDAGLFFDDVLVSLRTELSDCSFDNFPRYDRLKALCALINHDVAVLERKTLQRKRPSGSDDILLVHEEIEKMIDLPSGIRITPDQMLTALIDAVVYPLDVALRSKAGSQSLSMEIQNELRRAYNVANAYHIASEMWLHCLWGGKVIEKTQTGEVIMRPADAMSASQAAVSEHRFHTHVFQLCNQVISLWRNNLTYLAKKLLTAEFAVTGIHSKYKKNRFLVKRTNNHRKRNVPAESVNWIVAHEEYLSPFIRLPLPTNPALNLELLNGAWQLLRSLARACLNQVSNEPAGFDWFLSHAVEINRNELRSVFRKALGFDDGIADAVIEFFTYKPRSDGLWHRPLIAVTNDEFFICSGPLFYGNLLRTAERWLQHGGFKLEQRGQVFEELARNEISSFLEKSQLISDFKVADATVYVGPDREEIDLLIRIGSLILVGEAKCQLFPVSSIEMFRYRERLREGAEQASRKAEAVRHNISDVYSALEFEDDGNVFIFPFVLSNSLIGSGYPIDGVAVCDLLYLGTLLRDGGLWTMAVLDRDGIKDHGFFRKYYNSQKEAERLIPKLLMDQPVVGVYENMVKRRYRPMPIAFDVIKVVEIYYAVSNDSEAIDMV